MKLQRLYSYTRQAIDMYNMINENDKIAIGVSGGKDSLTLLYALAGLKNFYPKKFDLVGIYVDLGLELEGFDKVNELCDELNVDLYIVKTEINDIVFNKRKESNPCALCAKMRKGALNNKAIELGCNKVAYAHHKDDIIETFMLSLFFEGRLNSFSPITFLDESNISVIRPLMLVSESEIIGFRNLYNLPAVVNKCPADGFTKREYIKGVLRNLNNENPGIKKRIFTAILNGNLEGWNDIYGKQ